jgi:hypothetical protein
MDASRALMQSIGEIEAKRGRTGQDPYGESFRSGEGYKKMSAAVSTFHYGTVGSGVGNNSSKLMKMRDLT